MANIKPVKLGNNVRMSFAKINEVLDMPNLIEVQKNSYQWFLEEGLRDVFNDVSSITDYTGNLVLEFIDYRLDEEPKYTVEQCKEMIAARDRGVGILLISADFDEILEVSDRIVVMFEGQIMGVFSGKNPPIEEISLAMAGK